MNALAALFPQTEPEFQLLSVEDRVRAFLDGETNGEDLLHSLYGHVADEPIPERMRALLHK